ncbi:phage tail tube protein [Megalodesulfovibrio paquesii]
MAVKPIKWSNVAVRMTPVAAGSPVTLAAVTNAAEPVCSATAHGFVVGDYLWLTVDAGMMQLNNRIARVKAATADTFTLENLDTTLFDADVEDKTYARKLSFDHSLATATTVSPSGGEPDQIDTTTIHSSVRTSMPGLPSAASYSFDAIWDPADAGQQAFQAAADAQDMRAFQFQFGTSGRIMVFAGYPSANGLPAGSAQGLVTTKLGINLAALATNYAS